MLLVTGGKGFVARNIVRLLVEKGQKVRCLVRESSPRNVLDGLDVEFCTGDIMEMKKDFKIQSVLTYKRIRLMSGRYLA